MILRNCRYSSISYWSQSFRLVSVSKLIQRNSSLISNQYKRMNMTLKNDYVKENNSTVSDRSDHRRHYCTSTVVVKKDLTTFERNELRFKLNIFEKKILSQEEWSSLIKEKADTLGRSFNKEVFDTFILQKCFAVNNVELAMSYLNNIPLAKVNFLALSYYLMVLGKNINSDRSDLFLDIYHYLNKDPSLPDLIVENIIKALCFTNYWQLAVGHIKYIEKSKSKFKNREIYNCWARTLIKNVSWKEGMNYLIRKKTHFSPAYFIEDDTITEILYSICHNTIHDQKKGQLKLFLKYLQPFEKPLNDFNANIVCSMGGENLLSVRRLNIANGESCQSCGGSLDLLPVDEGLVSKLKYVVEKSIVRGNDIFENTTPKEWKEFNEFLNSKGPFDVVVDGLNLLFLGEDSGRRSNKEVSECISVLTQHYKNILVLSRKHSMHRFERLKRSIPELHKVKTFYLDDLTKDDVFIIYAALHSGWGCHIITRDYLRNYKDGLKKYKADVAEKFFHWQSMHQLIIKPGLKFFKPYQYHRVLQYNNVAKSWHIPIEICNEDLEYFTHPDEWLCIKDLQEGGAIMDETFVEKNFNKKDNSVSEKNFGQKEGGSGVRNVSNSKNIVGNVNETKNVRNVKLYKDFNNKREDNKLNKWKTLLEEIEKDVEDISIRQKPE